MEEPLDPANQSLSDALRVSFKILKFIMLVVLVFFLASGVFLVEQSEEEVVLLQFGVAHGPYKEGVHWGWPYPVGEVIRVPMGTRTLNVDDFWMKVSSQDKGKPPSQLTAREQGLDPAVDGSVITGDRSIMHIGLEVNYAIRDSLKFVRNVRRLEEETNKTHGEHVIRTAVANATVANVARATEAELMRSPGALVENIRQTAQKTLDRLETGIQLNVKGGIVADQRYWPLQVKDAVLNVQKAENTQNELIQQARKGMQEKLQQAAGPAWEKLRDEIRALERAAGGHVAEARSVEEILAALDTSRIDEILMSPETAGQAKRILEEAKQERERILLATQARHETFVRLLNSYRANPTLFKEHHLQDALIRLHDSVGVKRWMLPFGEKNLVLWFNPDPKEMREAEEERIRQLTRSARGYTGN